MGYPKARVFYKNTQRRGAVEGNEATKVADTDTVIGRGKCPINRRHMPVFDQCPKHWSQKTNMSDAVKDRFYLIASLIKYCKNN
jgi:hypothetical protein